MREITKLGKKHGWSEALITGSKNPHTATAYCPTCGAHFDAVGDHLRMGGRAMCNGERQMTETKAGAQAHMVKVLQIQHIMEDMGWQLDATGRAIAASKAG